MAETWSQYLMRISSDAPQKAIAEATGTDTGTVSRWIRGQNNPRPDAAIRVARVYGRPAGEALVAAGILTPADLGGDIEVRSSLDDLSDEALLAELARRVKR